MSEHEEPCPACGGPTEYAPDCPGYGNPVMVCWPPDACGNATQYRCQDRVCPWWYREPNNRGDKARMGVRPAWLGEGGR